MSKTNNIVGLLQEAQTLAFSEFNILNILQPGIVKEMIMADILGHNLITQKNLSDAKDGDGNFYEYLASINRTGTKINKGCSFQIDRIVKNKLSRITRNKAFFFGVFKNHFEIQEIWEINTQLILGEVQRQLVACKNEIVHVNFLLKWVKENGKRVC